ncbi:ImuA family protein [Qipengyuania qiaonensis]|uniref:Protein ImuA n=1 Tax=Qipengyuania qiaonensis TaxID=2867240 RepID=A0ABS7J8G0_9SPHN|nr:hypothetical protein [Qipengyuania qiaonensis]MBX7483546.1 hypothetical protein [Qipengyuania qiaonensis]
MRDSAELLSSLRELTSQAGVSGGSSCHGVFPSGHASLDAYLDGGFQRGQLHEIFAESAQDNASSAAFAGMLGLLGLQTGKSMLWLRTLAAIRKGGRFNPAGFSELGGDPATLFMGVAGDETVLLRSASEALRSDAFGVVVIECWGTPAILDLTASRRLTLAADRGGVTAILLRLDAREQPSTASTRWVVRSAPSVPLEANAPGYPTFDLTLSRRRSGPSGKSWRVEWDRDKASFREPARPAESPGIRRRAAVSGTMVSFPGVEQAAAGKSARHIA